MYTNISCNFYNYHINRRSHKQMHRLMNYFKADVCNHHPGQEISAIQSCSRLPPIENLVPT